MKGCPCSFIAVQKSKDDVYIIIEFEKNIIHGITKPKARQIRGEERNQERKKYFQNSKLNPSDVYRNKLHSLPPNSYACGNRDGAGVSKKTHQNIKAEAIRDINSFDVLHKEILNLQKRLHDQDNKWCLDNQMIFRKLFGFIQTFSVTNDHLKLILFHEKEIRLFHDLCSKDILYLDATGGLVTKVPQFEKIFLYSLAMRHPFGKTFPLPTGMYITSVHTTESVRFFLMTIREQEKNLYGNNTQPRLIISDNSKVLQNACLREFNGESRLEYHQRTYRIVTGNATEKDLLLSIMVSCHTHIIGQSKRFLSKSSNSQKNIALRVVGRLINSYSLEELSLIVKNMFTVMSNKYVTADITKSLNCINESINDWSHRIEEMIINDESCHYGEKDEEDVDFDGSPWKKHWDECLQDVGPLDTMNDAGHSTLENETKKELGHRDTPGESKALNKYHMPLFLVYFRKTMLPEVDFWTKICFADMSHYGSTYTNFLKEPNICGKNFRIKNEANAPVENIFKFIKNDKSTIKIPLITFISKLSHKVDTLAKEFIDDIIKNLSKNDNFTKKNRKDLEKLQNLQKTPTLDEEAVPVKPPDEEKWLEGKKKQKKRGHSSYLHEPPTKVRFTAKNGEKSVEKEKTSFNTLEFRKFQNQNWGECSKSHKDMKSCQLDIKNRWKILNNDLKKQLKQNTICCENELPGLPTVRC